MYLNLSNFTSCTQPQTFHSLSIFFNCFGYFARKNFLTTFFGFLLFFLTLVSNAILAKNLLKNYLTIYDKIALAMCIMDMVTCLIDYPIYLIGNMFNYFPLSRTVAHIWASYDNNINTTTALHMLYMSLVLMKSVKQPLKFKNDFLVRQFKLIIISIWTFGFLIWIPVTNFFGMKTFSLDINFSSKFQKFILSFIFWFCILISLLCVGISLMLNMNILKNKRITFFLKSDENSVKKKNRIRALNIHSQLKIVLLVFTFWIQWMIPCVFYLLDIFMHIFSDHVMNNIYWLTYTVCFTDPIVIYIFNPKIGLKLNRPKSSIKS